MQFWAKLTGPNGAFAVVLDSRVEAWRGDPTGADNPGEAAFLISLEADPLGFGTYTTLHTFNGGAPVSTGLVLSSGSLDGNGAHGTEFNSGLVELSSTIPAGSDVRLSFDAQGAGATGGYLFGVDDVLFRIVAPGDVDGDGDAESDDLFRILAAGKFNNPALGPASWAEGDFNGDDLVNSANVFLILAGGHYNAGPYTTTPGIATIVPEPSTLILGAFGLLALLIGAWRREAPCKSLKKPKPA